MSISHVTGYGKSYQLFCRIVVGLKKLLFYSEEPYYLAVGTPQIALLFYAFMAIQKTECHARGSVTTNPIMNIDGFKQ
jgi:hypothetical protein